MGHRQQSIADNLAERAAAGGVAASEAVSFKLRPVADRDGQTQTYVSGYEYDSLRADFGLTTPAPGRYRGGRAFRIGAVDLVEHETGPELIALLPGLIHAAAPYIEAAGVVTTVVQAALWLRNKFRGTRQSAHSPRFIRVEARRLTPRGTLTETVVTMVDLSREQSDAEVAAQIKAFLDAAP